MTSNTAGDLPRSLGFETNNHSVLQQAVLENYKDSILLLRAKYASYEKIAELLHERPGRERAKPVLRVIDIVIPNIEKIVFQQFGH